MKKQFYKIGIICLLVCFIALLTGCDDLFSSRRKRGTENPPYTPPNTKKPDPGDDPYVPDPITSKPSTPQGFYAAANGLKILLYWDTVNTATGYNVYCSMDGVDGYYENKGSVTNNSAEHSPLLSGQAYYYKVSAHNDNGDSELSSVIGPIVPNTSEEPIALPNTYYFFNSIAPGATHYYTIYVEEGYNYFIDWQDTDYHEDVTLSQPIADIMTGVRTKQMTWWTETTNTGNYDTNLHGYNITSPGDIVIEVKGNNSNSSGYYAIAYNRTWPTTQ